MDLERAAARVMMVAARCAPDALEATRCDVLRAVRERGVGGLIIFAGERKGVSDLIHEARAAADGPLLVASDLERGLGWQVAGGTTLPSPMAVGATNDPTLAFESGRLTAAEARSVGIDVVLAPVADLADREGNPIVGNRSYGADPSAVRRHVEAFVRGCREGGAAAAVKHFPGHGGTSVDSHIELPVVDSPADVLRERDLEPFRGAVEAGVDLVMTAHVAYPELDASGLPAGFSRKVIGDLLRGELSFEGLVITDALIMGGAESVAEDPAVLSFRAGGDILLMPHDLDVSIAAVAREAASDDRLAARLRASAEAVGALAGRVQATAVPSVRTTGLAERIAGAAATSLGTPLDGELVSRAKDVAIVVAGEARYLPERPPLVDAIERVRPVPGVFRLDESGGSVVAALEMAAAAGATIVALYDELGAWRGGALPKEDILDGVRRVLRAAARPILVLCMSPFVLRALDHQGPAICVWDTTDASQRAAAAVLLGESAGGVSPVSGARSEHA
jgi:beta-N-acetylhexosaminidase